MSSICLKYVFYLPGLRLLRLNNTKTFSANGLSMQRVEKLRYLSLTSLFAHLLMLAFKINNGFLSDSL